MARPSHKAVIEEVTAWDFSCPDWEERLKLGKSLLPNLPLNKKEANRSLALFNKLRLPDVHGNPTLGESSGPWLGDIVKAIFGSLTDDLTRHVPEVFSMVPKKNAKTTGGAAIMITALLMNERPRAEFGLVGPTHEIADLAFDQAAGMIKADDEGYLQKRFHVRDHLKEIVDRKNEATLKIKTFDLTVATGSKWAGLLIDEVHIMSTMSFATRLIGQLRGGMITNPEAFMVMITTQSDQPPAGVFKSELDYARGVRDGRIKGDSVRMLPMIYEFSEKIQTDETQPWRNPKMWYMVTPNLGKSIKLPRLIADYETAVEKGDEELRRWASQHLNIEIGLALHHNRWRGADYWLSSQDEKLNDLDELLASCEVAVVGGDGGGLDDLLGIGVIGRHRETKEWHAWAHAWAQSDVHEKRKDISELLNDFEKEGDLTLLKPHETQRDVTEFCDVVEKVFKSGLLPAENGVGLDPFAISSIVDELASRGIYIKLPDGKPGPVTGIKQGSALSPASWGMERKLKDGTFKHFKSAFMNWVIGNAKSEQRGSAILITKQVSGKAKIDPFVALLNAFTLMSKNPVAKPRLDLDSWLSEKAMAVQ